MFSFSLLEEKVVSDSRMKAGVSLFRAEEVVDEEELSESAVAETYWVAKEVYLCMTVSWCN